jgi:hypothetical protein
MRQTQLQPQTQAAVVGQTLLRNGIGGGNIVGTLRHSFSPKIWAEVCWKNTVYLFTFTLLIYFQQVVEIRWTQSSY